MLKAIIIDDEIDAIDLLDELLRNFISIRVQIVGKATNLHDGIELIKSKQPDVVFLDINMPGNSGLEIYREYPSPGFKIIFVTAYPQFAVDAFRHSSTDYLLKPINIVDLKEALQKVATEKGKEKHYDELEENVLNLAAPNVEGKYLVMDTENGFIMPNSRNIEYCYANQAYSYLVSYTKKEVLVTKSLRELEEMLPENHFYRTHRSYLVNIYYIKTFVHSKESYLLLKSGTKIPVSVRVSYRITNDLKKMVQKEKEFNL